MALKTYVKISAVNNLSDARYCAGMLVDAIGFPMDTKQDNNLNPTSYAEITEWIAGVDRVVEFESNDLQTIQQICSECELEAIQVSDIDLLEALQTTGKKLIYKVDLASKSMDEIEDEISDVSEYIEYLLIENSKGETLQEELDAVFELAKEYDIVLGFGIEEKNVSQLISSEIKGISIKGGEEIRPGFKDYDEMADILEALEEE
ncbi:MULTISPECIES: hypothetical protein [Persicobacter]|uniref:N-(5'-phosphoribosyl)anthranilate isomerase n=1 Tax=Persicobacter diffluens TaxID=981 RepID=A0AAN4VXA9_9BACT|nr:hypothetical protein [Persicobacter sp. CCB-QB2]GJM60949.1 hypothetical protein PEDI_15010 [Persicobacter diffluens]